MDKKLVGLIGVVGALAATNAATAKTMDAQAAMNPASYSELLVPVANAADILQAVDRESVDQARVQLAQFYRPHHHHHHHRWWRPRRHHHHHHHPPYRRY